MISSVSVEMHARMTLAVPGVDGTVEEWTVGSLAGQPDSILIQGREMAVDPLTATRSFRVPEGCSDREAVLLPLAVQMIEAVRRTEAALGDRLPVLGKGLRCRLAVLAAERRGIVTAMSGDPREAFAAGDRPGQPAAALVLEAGRGFEAAACRAVRSQGIVVLATGPQGASGEFDFYRNLQKTGARLIGVAPSLIDMDERMCREAGALIRAFFVAQGDALPMVTEPPQASAGTTEYLVRWCD